MLTVTNVDQVNMRARGFVMDEIDRRTTDAGEMIQSQVTALRSMGQDMRSQGMDPAANVVYYAADRLGIVSTYLTKTDGDRIVHDVENVAREHTLLTAALGFVTGFVAALLLKSSASERNRFYRPADGT
jgi:hypothetical protein